MGDQAEVENLARAQIDNYRIQPRELLSHFNREESALGAYRGRRQFEAATKTRQVPVSRSRSARAAMTWCSPA